MTFHIPLQLAKNVSLSDHVNLVALPEAENDVPTTDCVVAGWGSMAYDAANISDVLREVNVTIDTSLNCETPSQLCTRGPNGPFKVSEPITHTSHNSSLYFANAVNRDGLYLPSNDRETLVAHLFVVKWHAGWCQYAEEMASRGPTTTLGLLTTAPG